MIYDIKVNEHPIIVKDSIDESWKTVPASIKRLFNY
jgi:hypothetical protein